MGNKKDCDQPFEPNVPLTCCSASRKLSVAAKTAFWFVRDIYTLAISGFMSDTDEAVTTFRKDVCSEDPRIVKLSESFCCGTNGKSSADCPLITVRPVEEFNSTFPFFTEQVICSPPTKDIYELNTRAGIVMRPSCSIFPPTHTSTAVSKLVAVRVIFPFSAEQRMFERIGKVVFLPALFSTSKILSFRFSFRATNFIFYIITIYFCIKIKLVVEDVYMWNSFTYPYRIRCLWIYICA